MEPKMVMHPIKPQLNGKSLVESKDPDGFPLFIKFVEAVKKTPAGTWVDYKWAKTGEPDATPKTSYVKKCMLDKKEVVVGSGTWK